VAFVHPSLSVPKNILEKFSTNLDLVMIGSNGEDACELLAFRLLNLQRASGEPVLQALYAALVNLYIPTSINPVIQHDSKLPQ
jgi:hypothetical protein